MSMCSRVPAALVVVFSLAGFAGVAAADGQAARRPAAAAPANAQAKLSDPAALAEKAPDLFRARFDTSKGAFVMEVHREWAPNAADRFYNLVKNGFYDGTRFFRVLDGFMVQFGLHGDPAIQAAWQSAALPDEPATQSNTRGFVTFTKESAPNTRYTQLFINYRDNSYLDADGFAPFAQVVSGMEVVDMLYAGYGRQNVPDQRRIIREGNAYLQQDYPKLDIIKRATIAPLK